MEIGMSPEEVDIFLAENKVCRLATVPCDGVPHVVPVWYVILDGEIFIETSATTQKAKNLGDSSKVAIVVDKGEMFDDFKGVMIRGEAESVSNAEVLQRVREAVSQKYFGSNTHPGFLYLSNLPERIVFRVKPEKTSSWDSSKI